MTIYIDAECKCHVNNPDGTYTALEAPKRFNDKCAAYIEGYRVKPEGYTFTREDGMVFGPEGESVSPWKPLSELEAAQAAYEQARAELLVPAEAAYMEGVNSI